MTVPTSHIIFVPIHDLMGLSGKESYLDQTKLQINYSTPLSCSLG